MVIPVANSFSASRDQEQNGKQIIIREGNNSFFENLEQLRVEMRKMGRRIRTRLHAFSEVRVMVFGYLSHLGSIAKSGKGPS